MSADKCELFQPIESRAAQRLHMQNLLYITSLTWSTCNNNALYPPIYWYIYLAIYIDLTLVGEFCRNNNSYTKSNYALIDENVWSPQIMVESLTCTNIVDIQGSRTATVTSISSTVITTHLIRVTHAWIICTLIIVSCKYGVPYRSDFIYWNSFNLHSDTLLSQIRVTLGMEWVFEIINSG